MLNEPLFDRVQLFIPEGDRTSKDVPVDLHDRWVFRFLTLCGDPFNGATSYGRGVGVWKSNGVLCWDRVSIVEVWIDPEDQELEPKLRTLCLSLLDMGRELRQSEVGYILNGRLRLIQVGDRP